MVCCVLSLQKAGCDGVLGSLAREDHCGVCNGSGKSCRVVRGEFNRTRGPGTRRFIFSEARMWAMSGGGAQVAHSSEAVADSLTGRE